MSAKERVHNDQASQAAARGLSVANPRLCSTSPSVMTTLYSTTVSRALRASNLWAILKRLHSRRTWSGRPRWPDHI